jgi:hypothetical protein
MKNAQPEPQDFQFSHKGFNYAIGFQDDGFDTFAMSTSVETGTTWSWAVSQQIHDKEFGSYGGSSMEFLKQFLVKCNKELTLDEDVPEAPVDEMELLLYTVEHGLQFSPTSGVTIK